MSLQELLAIIFIYTVRYNDYGEINTSDNFMYIIENKICEINYLSRK
jgi:hypothetical protein